MARLHQHHSSIVGSMARLHQHQNEIISTVTSIEGHNGAALVVHHPTGNEWLYGLQSKDELEALPAVKGRT
jgi:hypothetical protein